VGSVVIQVKAARLIAWLAMLCAVIALAQGDPFAPRQISTYPFQASAQREALIRSRYKELRPGMALAEVRTILGEPDEVRPAYDPNVRRARLIGHTWWYVVRRLVEHGSEAEMREALVRVRFNLEGKIESVVQWGLEAAVNTGAAPSPAHWAAAARRMLEEARSWGDQAYGAVLVLDDQLVGEGPSRVVKNTDPSAHAEREAIRDAQRRLQRTRLDGSVLYSTSRPCGACEEAAAEAGVARMIHGADLIDAGAPRR
jgi:tRNA(Arg) A34 adenosine deaminase TadA/outer membrane protein assembly factor BamE (lipoprotein component of BamABCDE complex)